jgi:plastocyanin
MAKLVRIWRRGLVATLPLAAALALVLGGVAATPAQAQWPGPWGVPWGGVWGAPWGGLWGAPWTGLGYGFPGGLGTSLMSGTPMSSSMGGYTSSDSGSGYGMGGSTMDGMPPMWPGMMGGAMMGPMMGGMMGQHMRAMMAMHGPGLRAVVTMYDNFFLPSEITVPVGTTVTWMNHGTETETTTSPGIWDSGPLRPHQHWSAVFAVKGTFDYVSTPHGSEMRGRINVVDAPAMAMSSGMAGMGAMPPATSGTAGAASTTGGAAAAPSAMASLTAQQGSGVTGQATLSQSGGTTTVSVTLSGLPPNSSHAGHIHGGSCAGAILFPLGTITADSSGRGSATATVSGSIDTSNWWVQYHVSDSPPGPPISCGQVMAGM